MELIYTEAEALFGGNLLEGEPHIWGHEMALFDGKVDEISTCFMPTAPQRYEEETMYSPEFEGDVSALQPNGDDWLSQADLSIFSDLIPSASVNINTTDNFTNIKVDQHATYHHSKLAEPLSPTGSYDSGVSSPGSTESYLSISSENASPPSFTVDYLQPQDDLEEIGEDLLNELGIALLPPQPISVAPAFEYIEPNLLGKMVPPHPVETETSELESLLSTNATNSLPSQLPSLPQDVTIEVLPKPRPGRKSKITSLEEKKQRKRDQNKNAAARYRDRRRRENDEKLAEFNVLETKNKSLNDKISQITNEIDYLKELMIEVYKIKGLIS